jgi:hypothetical protein
MAKVIAVLYPDPVDGYPKRSEAQPPTDVNRKQILIEQNGGCQRPSGSA